jgi:hypothetical protein
VLLRLPVRRRRALLPAFLLHFFALHPTVALVPELAGGMHDTHPPYQRWRLLLVDHQHTTAFGCLLLLRGTNECSLCNRRTPRQTSP